MTNDEVRRCWEDNADAWTKLARAGYDVYRDYVNTPAFLQMLPPVSGRKGIDIGCGEGHNTRLIAERGALMTAIDISESFLKHAREYETSKPHRIDYQFADATALPFSNAVFDFATAFMSLMDIPKPELALSEVFRVLKPGGFFQFSIIHPCFDTPYRRNLRNSDGLTYAIEVGDYFRNLNGEVTEWLFSAAPSEIKKGLPKFRTPRFTRTISQWMNMLRNVGFWLEHMNEPFPDDEAVRACPDVQDAQVVAYFLHIRVRKYLEDGATAYNSA